MTSAALKKDAPPEEEPIQPEGGEEAEDPEEEHLEVDETVEEG